MAPDSNAGEMTALLTRVQQHTKTLLDFYAAQSLPEPSYAAGDSLDPSKPLPPEVQAAREGALEATDELHHLLLGPLGLLLSAPGDQYLLIALQYLYRYGIAELIPRDGSSTSFGEIAAAAGLPESDVARFLRVAIARHVLHEPVKGKVVHTAASRMILDNPLLECWLMNIAHEFLPSLARTVDATQKWPGSEEPNECGYSLGHNTSENPFTVIKQDPVRHKRFTDSQLFSHRHDSFSIKHLLDHYDFGSIPSLGNEQDVKTLVDVGGSRGEVAAAVAARWSDVRCVVQDLPKTIAGLDSTLSTLPPDVAARISGKEHDFLTPQTVRAGCYLLRWVMHDWSDKYAVLILQNLIPALSRGSRVVISDICIPEPGRLPIFHDRQLRKMDISMKAFSNARERDGETWMAIFAKADPRFKFLGIVMPLGARMAIIEAEWTG